LARTAEAAATGGGAVGATAAGEGVGALTTLERAAATFTTPFCCLEQDGPDPPPDNWVVAEETCRFCGGYGALRGGTGAAAAGAGAWVVVVAAAAWRCLYASRS
jgi:hypothetical protein